MDDQPWNTYSRGRLLPDFRYPVGRSAVEAALRAAEVRVGSLSFSCPDARSWAWWSDRRAMALLTADWYGGMGTSYFLKRGTVLGPRTSLTLHAVPHGAGPLAAQALTATVLAAGCAWLVDAAGRPGTVWAGESHQWRALLRDGKPVIEVS